MGAAGLEGLREGGGQQAGAVGAAKAVGEVGGLLGGGDRRRGGVGGVFVGGGGVKPALPSAGVRNLGWVAGVHGGTVTVLDVAALLSGGDLVVDERVG